MIKNLEIRGRKASTLSQEELKRREKLLEPFGIGEKVSMGKLKGVVVEKKDGNLIIRSGNRNMSYAPEFVEIVEKRKKQGE